MKIIEINTSEIIDWKSFHTYFSDSFGFPDYYGNNMDAWIDCMTYIDEKEMTTKIFVEKNDFLVFRLFEANKFSKQLPDIYLALLESSSFVNERRIASGEAPLIFLSF